MARTTGSRQWDPNISGAQLQLLREREELSRREVAERLGELMGRPVAAGHIREMEDGSEPSQEVFGHLMDVLHLQPGDELKLYPPTEAELDRRRDYAERRADLAKQQAALDKEWQPVRYRSGQ